MALAHAILTMLLEQPATGYGLAKRFDRSVGYFWQATHQQIYREMARLEAAGLAQSEVIPQEDRPDKRVYSITQEGRDHLAEWLGEPSAPAPMREDLLVQVRAGSLVDRTVILEELRRRRDLHAQRLATYKAIQRRDFPDPSRLDAGALFIYLPLLRGLMFETDNVAWCEQAIALIEGAAR
jgi:DNA-binding PadR family transcriptional regulator